MILTDNSSLKQSIDQAELVLVGIGEEWMLTYPKMQKDLMKHAPMIGKMADYMVDHIDTYGNMLPFIEGYFYSRYMPTYLQKAYERLFELIKDKNYYIVSLCMDNYLEKAGFAKERKVNPCGNFKLLQCKNCMSVKSDDTNLENLYSLLDRIAKGECIVNDELIENGNCSENNECNLNGNCIENNESSKKAYYSENNGSSESGNCNENNGSSESGNCSENEEAQIQKYILMLEKSAEKLTCGQCAEKLEYNTIDSEKYVQEGYKEEWDRYMKWLQGTVNKKLCIIEAGVGLDLPSVIRWPFEKTLLYNKKACLFRIHKKFYQLAEETADRSYSCEQNSVEFFGENTWAI